MPSTVLLTLPPELLLKVIHLLPTSDVRHLQSTCRHLRSLVEFSGFHTYAKQLHSSGVHDDFPPGFSYLERLKALKQRDENWASLRPRSIARMSIPFHASGIYDLTGGVFLLGYKSDAPHSASTRGFCYTTLPTIDSDSGSHSHTWPKVEFESDVIDVGLAIPEHDLIAVVTCKPDVDAPFESSLLELHLLSASSPGQPHPSASRPVIPVDTRDLVHGHCSVLMEIVGDYLGLLITYPWAVGGPSSDAFYLVQWKLGKCHTIMKDMRSGTYAHFVFLREDLLLFPKMRYNVLEISKIIAPTPDSTPYLQTLRTLHLPDLALSSILRFACRAEPNPQAISSQTNPSPSPLYETQTRMFRDDPSSSIIIFHLLLHGMAPQHLNHLNSFVFIAHRSSLLSLLPQEDLSLPFARAEYVPTMEEIHKRKLGMTWGEWDGERKTRWFSTAQEGMLPMRWITTTAGMRWVTMAEGKKHEVAGGGTVTVRDFNPHWVKKVHERIGDRLEMVERESGSESEAWHEDMSAADVEELMRAGPAMLMRRVVKEKSVLNTNGFFAQPLVSRLPFVETVTKGTEKYDGVLMDEQRIIGLRDDGFGIGAMDIHVLG